jgi:CheY-like chemotaxis protein
MILEPPGLSILIMNAPSLPNSTNVRASRKLKLLVVDDEAIVCDCIAGMLRYDGHEVQGVNSGRAALALLETTSFDLVFMDFSMPEMKGDELAVAVKALRPDQPIIMITGNAPGKSSLAGVDFLIDKPIMLQDLRKIIASWSLASASKPVSNCAQA